MERNIHPTASVASGAKLGKNVTIGAFTLIGETARIDDDTHIGSNCEIGMDSGASNSTQLDIGQSSIIRSNSIIYGGSTFGSNLTTGHRVTLRENIQAGDGVQIGTLCDIQGNCKIGSYTRLHSNVHVGQHSLIGEFVWIFPYVVLTNDPHPPSDVVSGAIVEDFAIIATMSTVLPGRRIGSGALVGAMSLVREDVPSEAVCVGVPGKNVGSTSKIRFKSSGRNVYPWRRHFHRGYPEEIVKEWQKEFPNELDG